VEVAGARKAREKTSIQWRRRMKSVDLYINKSISTTPSAPLVVIPSTL
jgi:hypothetical protein